MRQKRNKKKENREVHFSEQLDSALNTLKQQYYGTVSSDYITQFEAMENEAVFTAHSIIAETISTFPLNIFEKGDRGSLKRKDHPIHKLINNPNPEMGSMSFWSAFIVQMMGGNGYAYIVRGRNSGTPIELRLLDNEKMRVERNRQTRDLEYHYQDSITGQIIYQDHEIFHVPALSLDGIVGISPIELFKKKIVEPLNVDNYIANYFTKGAFGQFIYEIAPEAKVDKKKIRFIQNTFMQLFGGLSNQGKPLVVDPGTKIHELKGYSNKDNDLVQIRKEAILKVARVYKMPPHFLAILDEANYSNVVAMNSQFYKITLLPWIKRVESEIDRQLIPSYDKEKCYCKINPTAILRGSDKERSEYYRTMRVQGVFSTNEIRGLEDMTLLDHPAADYHAFPQNMGFLERFDEYMEKTTKKKEEKTA